MVHVDDVVDACLAAAACAELSRGTYILAGPQALSTRELYNTLRREMGMRPVTGSIPVWMLLLGAKTGDMLGTMTRCRMPLDSETVWKLLGNSWYDGSKAARELGIQYENDDRPFLDEDIPPA
jgi:nucleoside-diphosphate-sugar epimerase